MSIFKIWSLLNMASVICFLKFVQGLGTSTMRRRSATGLVKWTLQVTTVSCLVADVYISPHSGDTKMKIRRA